jgi:hypothetical protein
MQATIMSMCNMVELQSEGEGGWQVERETEQVERETDIEEARVW